MSASTDVKDENSTGRRRLLWIVAAAAATMVVTMMVPLFLLSRISIPLHRERVFGAFDGSHVSLSVTVIDEPPFQFLIALPRGVAVPTDWTGSITLNAPDGTQWSSHCSAAMMEVCNWLHDYPDLDCHILTWKSTPRLSEFMRPHVTYKLTITGNRPFSSPAILLLSGIKQSREPAAKTSANKTDADNG
jgi:hypothetical protein